MANLKTTLAAATLAAAALTTATTASAADYRKCKDTEAAVAGGLIGGSLGTIIGEEIAGRGDKTEGAIAGAVIGGIVGAAIGDGASDCEKDGRIYRNGRYIGNSNRGYTSTRTTYPSSRGYSNGYQTVGSRGRGHAYGHHKKRKYDRGYSSYNNTAYELSRVERTIDELRRERAYLKDQARYRGYSRYTQRRLDDIGRQLDALKSERKRLERSSKYRNDRGYHDAGYRNGGYSNGGYRSSGHYHGSNVCYSNH